MIKALIDAINMYPSIKTTMIRKAVSFFSKGITTAINNKIVLCLDLIHLVMGSTLIDFDRYYYKYHGGGE